MASIVMQPKILNMIRAARTPKTRVSVCMAAALVVAFALLAWGATVNWPFTAAGNYTVSDTTKVEIVGGVARLIAVDQTDDDNAATGFGGGTHNQTQWDSGNSWLELQAGQTTGDFTSRVMDAGAAASWDSISWTPQRPLYKELPDNKGVESGYPAGSADMTGNVLLMHLNESPATHGTTISDDSGESNNGTLNTNDGAADKSAAGKLNTAISFDDVDDYVDVPDAASLDITDAMTIEAWLDSTSLTAPAPTKAVYSSAGANTFTVPAGVTSITVKAWGAGGGGGGGGTSGGGGEGGGGGFAEATLSVTPSEVLDIHVGGAGGGGAFSGGANGDYSGGGGGGGGRSEVSRGATTLIVAAGGGGGGGGDNSSSTEGGDGGPGGGTTGTGGSSSGSATGGGGGTQSAGGSGGTGGENNGAAGASKSGGGGADGEDATGDDSKGTENNGGTTNGGDGGQGDENDAGWAGGGGGGSGYYGGGGGGSSFSGNAGGGGGGGGSSYTTGSGTVNTGGSGTSAGNNSDPDYADSAGQGGTGGGTSAAGSAGNPGRIVITYAINRVIVGKGKDAFQLQIDDTLKVRGFINDQELVGTKVTKAWHHIALTYDKDAGGTEEVKLYVDGVQQDSADYSTAIATNASNLKIGERVPGTIDEVAVYSRALSVTEVADHYKRGAVRLRYQVRSGSSDPPSGSFIGPDGTTGTYYSELSNSTTGLPSLALTNVANNQYFQYKAYLETDDSSYSPELKSVVIGPTHYPGDNPTAENNTGQTYTSLTSFAETLGAGNQGSVKYQISNNGTSWYYWNGSNWVAASGYAQTNTAAEVNTNCGQFDDDVGTGDFYFKAFLHSDTASQQVELDQVDLGYTVVVLSVSVSNSTFAFGTNPLNTWLDPDTSVIINDGEVAEDFLGKISQFTDGSNNWGISAVSNGADVIRAQWSITSDTGPWTDISAYDTDFTIETNVAVNDSVTLWFRIQTPTSTTSYSEYSSTFTVTAQEY